MQTPEFWSVDCQGNEPDFFVCMNCLNEVFWRKIPCPDCPTCHRVATYEPFMEQRIQSIKDWGFTELIEKAQEAMKEKLRDRLEGKL